MRWMCGQELVGKEKVPNRVEILMLAVDWGGGLRLPASLISSGCSFLYRLTALRSDLSGPKPEPGQAAARASASTSTAGRCSGVSRPPTSSVHRQWEPPPWCWGTATSRGHRRPTPRAQRVRGCRGLGCCPCRGVPGALPVHAALSGQEGLPTPYPPIHQGLPRVPATTARGRWGEESTSSFPVMGRRRRRPGTAWTESLCCRGWGLCRETGRM